MPLLVTVRTVKSFFLSFILFASTLSNAHARDHAAGEVEFATKTNAKTVKAGATFEVELKYKIAPGWHIGPRDSKKTIPTELEWILPKGVKLKDVNWPELNYFGNPPGYEGIIIVTAKLQAGKDLAPGAKLNLGVQSTWQVCKGICKLGEAKRLVKLTVDK